MGVAGPAMNVSYFETRGEGGRGRGGGEEGGGQGKGEASAVLGQF
jgi:hypothetical protein